MILVTLGLISVFALQESGLPETADAPHADPPVTVELHLLRGADKSSLPTKGDVFLGETLTARIDLHIDPDYLSEQVVPRFRRPLDLEFELSTPWVDGGIGYRLAESSTPVGATTSLVIDRDPGVLLAPTTFTGGAFRLERRIVITDPQWSLMPAVVRWTSAETFTDDLVRGRIPVDPQEQETRSRGYSNTSQALPTSTVAGFHGAIGDFRTGFRTEPPTADGLHRITWTFSGFGALTPASLPQFTEVEGAQVVAQRTASTADALQLHLELRPLPGSDAFRLPPWATFDPSTGDFRLHAFPVTRWDSLSPDQETVATVSTFTPDVEPAAPEATLDPNPTDATPPRTGLAETELPEYLIPLLLGSSLLIGVILLLVAKREPRDEPVVASAASPSRSSLRRTESPTTPPAPRTEDGFDRLARSLGLRREALYADGLADHLKQTRLPGPLQDRILKSVESRRRALFAGGEEEPPSDADWRALAEHLREHQR